MGFLARQEFLLGKLIDRLWPATKEDGAKIIVSQGGTTDELYSGSERRRHVRFPTNLAVRYGHEAPLMYRNFMLNASEGGVFIQCDSPFPPETILDLHFFIPLEEKLLAEFSGEVTYTSSHAKYGAGMHVKFFHYSEEDMQRFMSYLEESQHLLDINA